MILFPDGTGFTPGAGFGGSSVVTDIYAPTVTKLSGLEPITPPPQPMSGPLIVPTFPTAGPGTFTGPASLAVDHAPAVPTPVSTPPMGCSSCGAPAIVAVPRTASAAGVLTAANVPTAPDLQAMAKQAPWWVWVVAAILVLLVLRGLLK